MKDNNTDGKATDLKKKAELTFYTDKPALVDNRLIMITGIARSGTTLLGKILSTLEDVEYEFEDLLMGVERIEGSQDRLCRDRKGCIANYYESRVCSVALPVYAEEEVYCNDTYIEIFDKETGRLISRINDRRKEEIPSLNVDLLGGVEDLEIDCVESMRGLGWEKYTLTWWEKFMRIVGDLF